MNDSEQPLTPAVFYILLVLASRDMHGYQIMKQVHDVSDGFIRMGNGTLYGSIKRMLKDEVIEEIGDKVDGSSDTERRRYYRITSRGLKHLHAEIDRYRNVVSYVRQYNISERTAI